MNNYVNEPGIEVRENVLAGIVGAFLFSLAGGVIYFVLHLVGYVASISGLVGAVCAVKGYSIFAKKESKKGIVIATVVSLLVIVLAWFFCLAYDIHDVYNTMFKAGEIDFQVSFTEAIRVAPEFLKEPEVSSAYFRDLALGLVFCLIGCGSYVVGKFKNAGKAANAPAAQFSQPAENESDKTHIEK